MPNYKPDIAVGKRIQEARLRAGIKKQSKFADMLGRRPATAWRWEKKGVIPEPPTLQKIAELTNVSVRWLLTGSDLPSDAPASGDTYPAFEEFLELFGKSLTKHEREDLANMRFARSIPTVQSYVQILKGIRANTPAHLALAQQDTTQAVLQSALDDGGKQLTQTELEKIRALLRDADLGSSPDNERHGPQSKT